LAFVQVDRSNRTAAAIANAELRQKLSKLQEKGYDPVVTNEQAPHYQWHKRNLNRLGIDQAAAFAHIDQMVADGTPLRPKRVRKRTYYAMDKDRRCTPEIGVLYKENICLLNQRAALGQAEGKFCATNGRFNTAFTRLFTGGREYTTLDGVRVQLTCLDLAASQVYLLLHKLRQTQAARFNPGEMERFSALLRSGNFYEQILADVKKRTALEIPDSEAKVAFFRHVIYSKTHQNTDYRKAFNQAYPLFHQALMEMVTQGVVTEDGEVIAGFRNLAIDLQREESQLFLGQMLPQLYELLGEKTFLTTIHDSFYCLPEHVTQVKQVMVEVLYNHTQVPPVIKQDGCVAKDEQHHLDEVVHPA
jgi:hypothetical protein